MKKYIFKALFSVILGAPLSYAQNTGNVKSPQTYQLEKYGNIPVNLNTGSNAYGINLYSYPDIYMNEGFSIDLKYYGTGYVPSKKSNYVGLDWSLHFGGSISRDVRGIPDDFFPEVRSSSNVYGYLAGVRNCNQNNYQIYTNNYNAYIDKGIKVGILCGSNTHELEPDKFNFNFMDKSGYFFIGNNGIPIIVSQDKGLKIDISELSDSQPFKSLNDGSQCLTKRSVITITDGKGIKYFFGGDYENLDIYYPLVDQATERKFIINSWNLFKIEYPNANVIEVKYRKETINTLDRNFCFDRSFLTNVQEPFQLILEQTFINSQEINAENINYNTSTGNVFYDGTVYWGSSSSNSDSGIKQKVAATKKSLPQSILLNGVEIAYFSYERFDKYATWSIPSYKLTNIQLRNQVGQGTKDVKLSYYRYKDVFFLEKIQQYRKSKLSFDYLQEYSFDYYSKNALPEESTMGIDYWGYWNGKVNNKLIPNFTVNKETDEYSFTEPIRDTDPSYCSTALLKSITYPTKGRTEFLYEPHNYSQKLDRTLSSEFKNTLISSAGNIGGGRVQKVINYTEAGAVADTKEYKYVKNYTPSGTNNVSSGILSNYYRNLLYLAATNSLSKYERLDVYSDNIIETAMNSFPVLYSEVTEVLSNGGFVKNYFTDYLTHPDNNEVKTIDNNNSPVPFTFFPNNIKNISLPYFSAGFKRGHIFKQEFYDNNFIKLKEINTQFEDVAKVLELTNYATNVSGIYERNHYIKQFGGTFAPVVSTISEYSSSGVYTSQEKYTYSPDIPQVLSSTETTDSDGVSIYTDYAYPSNGTLMKNANMVEIPTLIATRKNGKIINMSGIVFDKNASTNNLLLPVSKLTGEIKTGATMTDVTFDLYDDRGNILQYTSADGIPVTLLWGYNQTLPVIKIEGITYATLAGILGFANTNTGYKTLQAISATTSYSESYETQTLIPLLDNIRSNALLKDYPITTYTHKPLVGVSSITPPSGIREYYRYDNANRLQKIVNSEGKILKKFEFNYKQ